MLYYIGDSHYEEEVGIGENDTHQDNNVSSDGNRNDGWQSGVNKAGIYDLKQPWFVIDVQYDIGYIGPVNFRDILKTIEKNHSYKLVPTFSGFHKKGCDEDMKKYIAGLMKHDWTWINPSLEPITVGMVTTGQDGKQSF